MGIVKDTVYDLTEMLDREQRQAESLVEPMHQLQSYLEEESKTTICGSLDRLLSRIRVEADNLIGGSARVVVSPGGRISVGSTYSDEDSDYWLKRLKSQGFLILTLEQFRAFVQSLKSEVAEGNLIPVIEFLRANTEFRPAYSPAPALRESQPSTSSRWKASDFLPAPPPHPPLPRGLFKD